MRKVRTEGIAIEKGSEDVGIVVIEKRRNNCCNFPFRVELTCDILKFLVFFGWGV